MSRPYSWWVLLRCTHRTSLLKRSVGEDDVLGRGDRAPTTNLIKTQTQIRWRWWLIPGTVRRIAVS
jgi:hypothetical protein